MSTTNLRDDLAALRIDRSRPAPASLGRRLVVALAILVLLLGGGYGALLAFGNRLAALPEVRTDSVRVMSLGQAETVLTATGYLESRQQAAVGARAPGRIDKILVDEGTKVKQGDLLAVLEHADLDASLASRLVFVEQTEATLGEAKNVLEQRERDLAREQRLRAKGAGTEQALEAAQTEFRSASARVAALTAAVSFAKAQAKEAEEAIRNMHVYAPFAGTVVTKDAEVGETIMPGGMGAASGRGSVATLANLDQLEVDTDVKEDYLSQLRKGQPAEVAVDAVTDRRYKGRLREIIPMGDRTRGIVKVKVTIVDADERLFPELSATVHFLPDSQKSDTAASEKGTFVPAAAIVSSSDGTFVWRLRQDKLEKVSVTTLGEAKGNLVQIRGTLAGGDTVVIDPSDDLTEGERVRAVEGQ